MTGKIRFWFLVLLHTFCTTATAQKYLFTCEGHYSNYCIIKHAKAMIDFTSIPADFQLNVTSLTVRNSSIRSLPLNLLKTFPRLKKLDATKCGLQYLDSQVFGSYNINYTMSVEALYLSENGLTAIERLSFNKIINLYVLDLSKNKIFQIHIEAFKNLRGLVFLDLSNNLIHSLDPKTFLELQSVYSIDLSKNLLSKFSFKFVEKTKNLDQLSLNSNKLVYLETSAENKSNVTRIQLVDNKLANISPLKHFKALEYLSISYNKNLQLNDLSFEEFSSALSQLAIAGVSLHKLENYTKLFMPLKNLWLLDLGNNSLKNLNVNDFSKMRNLEILLAYQNDLQTVQNYKNIRENFPVLHSMDVMGNKFKCGHLETLKKRLKSMEIFLTFYVDYIDDNRDNENIDYQNILIDCE